MTERVALVVNPTSTRVRPALRHEVEEALAPFGLREVLVTERGGHAVELASRAADHGATTIVVLGGDGTANEVACAVAGSDVMLAALPAGSTNVFARALGWPHPAGRALPLLVEALGSRRSRTIRLGRVRAGVTDRVFCVTAGVGIDADAVHLVEARPWLKTRFRHAGFSAATVVVAARASRSPAELAARIDGAETELLRSLVAACGGPYAYLGPRALDLVPGADYGERLRWMGLRTARLTSVAAVVAGALDGGRHLGQRSVVDGWAAEIEIASERVVAVQADGEALGWHTRVRLDVGPTLRALVPSEG